MSSFTLVYVIFSVVSMENVRVEVCTDKAVYVPGQSITGSVFIVTSKAIPVDSVRARLYGDISVQFTNKDFYSFANRRVFVNEEKELWHYSTLQEMLDMTSVDMNANHRKTGFLTGRSQFRFAFQLPYELATSFSCSGSPVQVKYLISASLRGLKVSGPSEIVSLFDPILLDNNK
ncbi:arrestin domain protein [Ancylostoma caninum]|uniref:Arrestin domain protein n=1 Tax=Ancylostoma caninum TaxID=29170 RepID=A0A368GR65_ANCCA|nr:arrestin domain protein [Ancylostoma caninum]